MTSKRNIFFVLCCIPMKIFSSLNNLFINFLFIIIYLNCHGHGVTKGGYKFIISAVSISSVFFHTHPLVRSHATLVFD